MNPALADLAQRPAAPVWRRFLELAAIPRPSGHEEGARQWLRQLAADRNWEVRQDPAGNLVLAVPGRGALADAPVLVLQAHLDMVCEQNAGGTHDFLRDPIRPRLDGDWLRAEGTTLGADNGVGVALALALAETPVDACPPLELLFTVGEEVGLCGALALDPAIVHGRRLLNLDSETDGVVTIGCAGGEDFHVSVAREGPVPPTAAAWRVQVRGLRGGHSGISIHEDRANAIVVLARLLRELAAEFTLLDFLGGSKKNAIPREAAAVLAGVPEARLQAEARSLQDGLREAEPDALVTVAALDPAEGRALAARGAVPVRFVFSLTDGPNGVVAMDPRFPDLVLTSNSLGVVHEVAGQDGQLRVEALMHARSAAERQLRSLRQMVATMAADDELEFRHDNTYPGWEPDPDNPLLAPAQAAHEAVYGRPARVEAIHAGLEAGILGQKLGTRQMLALGPTILDPHSPDERVHLPAVDRCWRLLQALVRQLP